MKNKSNSIENAVFDGIRKTINRFREQPFYYFTESDIHASLSRDIMEGHSDLFLLRNGVNNAKNYTISLVHHEYPTNFRYENSKLKNISYTKEEIDKLTSINESHGDRGNYDLVIINPQFVEDIFNQHNEEPIEALKHIINKDKNLTVERFNTDMISFEKELLFAVEVKFIHIFNYRNIQMEKEVYKDNNKLELALWSSNNVVKPINMVFCNSFYYETGKGAVVKNIKDYLFQNTPEGVCSIFVESFYSKNEKITRKPELNFKPINNGNDWTLELRNMLKI